MDTILNYLENMFMNLPKTEKVMRAKSELANMMEDKYTELIAEGKTDNEAVGIVISEFGNLNELSAVLGISSVVSENAGNTVGKQLSDEEVKAYITENETASKRIAFGVFLCVLSPVTLIVLGGISETYHFLSDKLAGGIGLSVLFILIAVAVGIFIYSGMKLEKYEYLKKEPFTLSSYAASYVQSYEKKKQEKFATKMITGVSLCIIGVLALIITGLFVDQTRIEDAAGAAAIGVMLALIAVATIFFVTAGMQHDIVKVLLQREEYAYKTEKGKKLIDVIGSIYWPVATCVYLIWSFVTSDWGYTWIVWPIAGVLFGAVSAICSVVCKQKEAA